MSQLTASILRDFWNRKKALSPHLSLRRLAMRSQLSASHLSRILSGQKKPSFQTILKLKKPLDIDQWGILRLKAALQGVSNKERILPEAYEGLLRDWSSLAILELADMDKTRVDPKDVARLLNISPKEALDKVKRLLELRLLRLDSQGRLLKTSKNIRFPATAPRRSLQNFHISSMQRATQALSGTDIKDYERRLITTLCFTTSVAKIGAAKVRIEKFLMDLSTELSASDTDSVYLLGFQLVPLTPELP